MVIVPEPYGLIPEIRDCKIVCVRMNDSLN